MLIFLCGKKSSCYFFEIGFYTYSTGIIGLPSFQNTFENVRSKKFSAAKKRPSMSFKKQTKLQ
jgi:hypothetical protein